MRVRRTYLEGVLIGVGLGAAYLAARWIGVALFMAGILAARTARP